MARFALPGEHRTRSTESAENEAGGAHDGSGDDLGAGSGARDDPGEVHTDSARAVAAEPADVGAEPGGDDSGALGELEGLLVIDRQVIQLFALVEEAVAGATHALVSGDREAARLLVAADADVDELYQSLESLVQGRLLTGSLSSIETQFLLSVLGMLPELERSGDLAEHVARRATRNLPAEMPARLRGYVERMGEVACSMWRMAADAYAGAVPRASERLESLDDEMDDLHVTFIAELVTAGTPVVVAIELALVGRFYERLGDHAVNLARRVPSALRPIVLRREHGGQAAFDLDVATPGGALAPSAGPGVRSDPHEEGPARGG